MPPSDITIACKGLVGQPPAFRGGGDEGTRTPNPRLAKLCVRSVLARAQRTEGRRGEGLRRWRLLLTVAPRSIWHTSGTGTKVPRQARFPSLHAHVRLRPLGVATLTGAVQPRVRTGANDLE
jgi:hypothetical protein